MQDVHRVEGSHGQRDLELPFFLLKQEPARFSPFGFAQEYAIQPN